MCVYLLNMILINHGNGSIKFYYQRLDLSSGYTDTLFSKVATLVIRREQHSMMQKLLINLNS